MTYVTTGLPNNGRTQYFNFQYDQSLSQARGRDLAADVMTYCDDDFSLVASWFSGRQLDMSPPINVSFATITSASDAGASWFGAGPWPLQVTIDIGELTMTMGTPTMLARYLLVSEVGEMYMRAFSPWLFNPWFATGEGSKGEGLSRFLAAQFLLQAYPGVAAIPGLAGATFNVSDLWLNSSRDNHIDDNIDDSNPDAVTGCATLFLFFLHDQLGFRIEDIINAGAGRLSNVYQNLTNDSWTNAWGKFRPLIDAHCPHIVHTIQKNGKTISSFAPTYHPPLDTIFPVSDLSLFAVPEEASWVAGFGSNAITVMVDHPAKIPLVIDLKSDDATIIPAFSVIIQPPAWSASTPLAVLPQSQSFTSRTVTLTASYAGSSLSQSIRIVPPGQLHLPPLEISVDTTADACQPIFVENTCLRFVIKNLGVFASQTGLVFSWSVTGATANATNLADLTISSLPAAGTKVAVVVAVRNPQGLQATGSLTFQTTQAPTGLDALENELRCRLSGLRNGTLSIPPWIPIEKSAGLPEQIALFEKQLQQLTRVAARVATLIQSIKSREYTR